MATRVLEGIARLGGAAILWGQDVPARRSRRGHFPKVDFYGRETMPSGLLGHQHPRCELAFVLSGRLNVCIQARTYEARQDDWMLFLPGVAHGECCLSTKRPYELLWLTVSRGSHLTSHLTAYSETHGYEVLSRRDFGPAPTELLAAWGRLTSGPWAALDSTRCELLRVVTFCLDRLSDHIDPPVEALHPLIGQIKAILLRDLTSPPSVPLVADEVALSPNYLSSLFHRETGLTIRQFVDIERVEASKQLLADARRSIKQVAHALGYADQHHFSRVFRRVTGLPPSRYRARAPGARETDTPS
jgi:AraC-like DNA-binding protein